MPVAVLGGMGYTVGLLIAELVVADIAAHQHAATAVVAASLAASAVAVVLLRRRTRIHRTRADIDRRAGRDR